MRTCRRGGVHGALLILLLMASALFGACQPTAPDKTPAPPALLKKFGTPPLTLELSLDRQRLTVAQRLTVTLRAATDEGHAVRWGEVKEVAGFVVASATEAKAELVAPGQVVFAFRLVLEPLAAGDAQIPALRVEAWEKSVADAPVTTVSSEPIQITVDTLLAKGDAGETISDIAPPLAQPLNPWWWAGLGGAAALALAATIFFVRRWRRRPLPQPPALPPHLLAYQALDRLVAADLLSCGQQKAFYASLSDILRLYLEQRFGLRAPEQTTEEFLAGLHRQRPGSPGLLDPNHQRLLRDFLSGCDLVKFAGHTPLRAEAEDSVERCRRFVRETEPLAPVDGKSGGKA